MKKMIAVCLAIVVASAAGCGDPTAIKAQLETRLDDVEIFALNDTPVSLPNALRLRSRAGEFAVRVESSFSFDVAWDINQAGEAVAYTPRMVANELIPVRRVGLLLADGPFEAIVKAPTGGYKYDSLLVVPVGKILLVDVIDPSCSAFSILGQNIRAKVQLDSVVSSRRTLYMHLLANPNCGFRDLVPGLPKE